MPDSITATSAAGLILCGLAALVVLDSAALAFFCLGLATVVLTVDLWVAFRGKE